MLIKILEILQTEMVEPQAWEWFHLLCLAMMISFIFLLYKCRKYWNEKLLKVILGTYGFIALTTEVLKQISWSLVVNEVNGVVSFDYQWYAFPFQLCSTPIYVCILCLFLKKCKWRDALLSYVAYITIWGSLSTIFFPDSCLVPDVLANIHTMILHYGSFVVSVYLLISKEVQPNVLSLKRSLIVFYALAFIANVANVLAAKSGIIGNETFNMFYISPYFNSELPVFSTIQYYSPYPLYLFIYLLALSLGALLVFGITYFVQKDKGEHRQKVFS